MLANSFSRAGLALACAVCTLWVVSAHESFAQTPVRTAVLSNAGAGAIQTAEYTPADNKPIVQPVRWYRGWGWGRPYYGGSYYSYYYPQPYVTYYQPAPRYYYYPRRYAYRGWYYY